MINAELRTEGSCLLMGLGVFERERGQLRGREVPSQRREGLGQGLGSPGLRGGACGGEASGFKNLGRAGLGVGAAESLTVTPSEQGDVLAVPP